MLRVQNLNKANQDGKSHIVFFLPFLKQSTTVYWLAWILESCHWMYYAKLPWEEHRALRHPSGRHPVFTEKPLQPGLMHFKHTPTHTHGRWLSRPFPLSVLLLVICGLFKWTEQRRWVALLDWEALNPGLRWSLLLFIAAQQLRSFSLAGLCHFLLRGGPDALSADILRQTSSFSCIVSIWGRLCA